MAGSLNKLMLLLCTYMLPLHAKFTPVFLLTMNCTTQLQIQTQIAIFLNKGFADYVSVALIGSIISHMHYNIFNLFLFIHMIPYFTNEQHGA